MTEPDDSARHRAAVAGLAAMMRGDSIEVEPIDVDGDMIGPAEMVPSPATEPEQRRRQADLN